MSLPFRIGMLLLFLTGNAGAQQVAAPNAKEPALQARPAAAPDPLAGQIQLDVVVSDKLGRPTAGLTQQDFTVLDNRKPQTLVSFHAVDSASGEPRQPVEILLLLDLVNASFDQASEARAQMEKYLEQNGGHLAYPASILVLSQEGLRIQPRPSTDGNALAAVLRQAAATAHTTGLGEIGRFQLSVRSLASIAENAARSPSRKILIWTGPGWPMMAGASFSSSAQDRQRAFATIVEVANRLREAHIAIYSLTPIHAGKGGLPGATEAPVVVHSMPVVTPEMAEHSRVGPAMSDSAEVPNYKEFVKGVKSAKQAETGDLALPVLAVQSGGRVLDPSNDLAAQIASCAEDLNAFYRLTFRPAQADRADELHDLTVQVAKPGLTARTTTLYYSQPQSGPALAPFPN